MLSHLESIRDLGHPGLCWVECGELRFVLFHPKRDETALRMGHLGWRDAAILRETECYKSVKMRVQEFGTA